jgi:hypothetical protein
VPSDEKTLGFASGTPNAAIFTLTANGPGDISVWGYGGDGLVDQNSECSYLNGFQLATAAVPEPASIELLAAATIGLMVRHRRIA